MIIKNVIYQVNGEADKMLKADFSNIACQLFDHLRDWTYSSSEEAEKALNDRLDFILYNHYSTDTAEIIRKKCKFIIVGV
jgi:hypothetical protein